MSATLQSILGATTASSLLRNAGTSLFGSNSGSGSMASVNAQLTTALTANYASNDGPVPDSAAVRVAKAQFTAPFVTPPWMSETGQASPNPSLSSIKSLKSLVDQRRDSGLPKDLNEAFTTYRALDRLKVVAEVASSAAISSTERAALSEIFDKGLTDLRKFLGQIAPDKLNLYFEAPNRVATSSPIRQGTATTSTFLKGTVATRTATLTSLDGAQSIDLVVRKGNSVYPVHVNLADIQGALTLDKIADALNAAIGVYSAKDSKGAPLLDGSGKPISMLMTKFTVASDNGKWGLKLQSVPNEAAWSSPMHAGDSLMVIGGQKLGGDSLPVQVRRLDDLAMQTRPRTASTITAIDSDASARALMEKAGAAKVAAALDIASAATDSDGNSYLLGTTAGAVDTIDAARTPEMFIRKISASGALVWQRPIGNPVSAQAAAISIGKDGNLVVAGSLIGESSEVQRSDGNIYTARFDLNGAELSRAVIKLSGDQRATAVCADAAGNTYVATRNGTTASGLYKVSPAGKVITSITSDNSRLAALQVAPDSSIVVLGRGADGTPYVQRFTSNLAATGAKLTLGDLQPADMVIAPDGTVGVSGTVYKTGTSDKDAVVSLIPDDLSAERRVVLGTTGAEEADSLTFAGNAFYIAGRTSGSLSGNRTGAVDGYVSRIDPLTGAISETLQFGKPGVTTGPLVIARSIASSAALESIGLGTGLLTPTRDSKLVDTTRLRAGDSFQLKLDAGSVKTFKIEATDTLSSLGDRIRTSLGRTVTVMTTNSAAGMTLRLQPTTGHALQLINGPAGADALDKLGLKASRLFATPPTSARDPKVKPGGQYGLDLSNSLTLATQDNAKAAMVKIKSAISMTQTAYRSLYWNESMVAKVEGIKPLNSNESAQLQQYRAAIARLGG